MTDPYLWFDILMAIILTAATGATLFAMFVMLLFCIRGW